jgi:ABC-type Fe3+-hydroxamate transport system substrate-binding protein
MELILQKAREEAWKCNKKWKKLLVKFKVKSWLLNLNIEHLNFKQKIWKTLIDQLDFHSFETSPKRIISLVPSQTELLYDLGLEDRIRWDYQVLCASISF